MTDADKLIRRITVETIIGLAQHSMANFQLVSVIEGEAVTTMSFELYHSARGIDGSDVKRVQIAIGTEQGKLYEM
jgi:hypothetical protein